MLEHRDQGGVETTMLVPPLESLFEKKNAVNFNLLIAELFMSFSFLNLVCPPFAKVVAQPVHARLPAPGDWHNNNKRFHCLPAPALPGGDALPVKIEIVVHHPNPNPTNEVNQKWPLLLLRWIFCGRCLLCATTFYRCLPGHKAS